MSNNVTLALLAIVVLVVYLADSAYRPYARCRHGCEGGRVSSKNGRRWRRCRWCGGRGSRVRFGRRLVDAVRGRGWDSEL